MEKIDRALEISVIDWLQWTEWPEKIGEKHPAQLALEMIEMRRRHCQELQAKLDKAVECLKFYAGGEHSDIDIEVFDHIKVVSDTTTEFDSEWLCGPAIETLKELGEL